MTKIQRTFTWFWMLGKRLLKQWSFVLLLCLIPILVPTVNMAISEDSGLVHIVLCHEGNDIKAQSIISSLQERDTLARFSTATSAQEATKMIANHKADLAWIFPDDFSKMLDDYAGNRSNHPVVSVIERESNMANRIANEMLFSAIYPDFAYDIYRNFSEENVVDQHNVSEDVLMEYYNKLPKTNDVVSTEKLNMDGAVSTIEVNYLNAPIRGLLAIMVLLCTLTAAMYTIRDRGEGCFDWLPPQKRLVPLCGSCFAAAILSATVMLISLLISKMAGNLWIELLSALLLIITVTAFSLLVSLPFSSYGKFGAVIPGILIVSLVLSPIFFNFPALENYYRLLPIYYYLNGIYQTKYHLWALLYAGILFLLTIGGNYLISQQKKQNHII